jgi:esterase
MTTVLAHQAIGEADEVVFVLHGLFGSSRNWQSVARRLRDRFRVYTVDLRNHGQSPHRPGMDYHSLSDDVLELADSVAVSSLRLVGHSMGGKVAMAVALRAPERVEQLAVVDIAPMTYDERFAEIIDAMQDLDLTAIDDRRDADQALSVTVPDQRLRGFLLQNLLRTENGYQWRLNLEALRAGLAEISDFPQPLCDLRYLGPTTFIAGGRSVSVRT